MTIREVFFTNGEPVSSSVLAPGTEKALGLRTPEGSYPFDESLVVGDSNTVKLTKTFTFRGGRIVEESRTLHKQAINDARLIRYSDSERTSLITWEEDKR